MKNIKFKIIKFKLILINSFKVFTNVIIRLILIACLFPIFIWIGIKLHRNRPNTHFLLRLKNRTKFKCVIVIILNCWILFFEIMFIMPIFIYLGFLIEQKRFKSKVIDNWKTQIKRDNLPKISKRL